MKISNVISNPERLRALCKLSEKLSQILGVSVTMIIRALNTPTAVTTEQQVKLV